MSTRILSFVTIAAAAAAPAAAQTFSGPTPYLSTADSPFPLGSPSFVLETFEDHLFNSPGVTATAGFVASTHFTGNIDSVDGDDGIVGNNACASCDSYYNSGPIYFQFNPVVLGGLPKKVGIVWTDGGNNCSVTFEAFDANGLTLGTVTALNVGDQSNTGTTGEDRFFGVTYAAGIKQIKVSNTTGGTEVDHLQYELPCSISPGTTYCTAKTSSLGCAPQIAAAGCPSASSGIPFQITCTQVISNKSGLLFYGYASAAIPFQGGTLCVQPPTRRTPLQSSGGNPPPDTCTGHFTFDMNAHIQSGVDTNLIAGATAYAQYWYRDPPTQSTTGLSNGLSFTIGP